MDKKLSFSDVVYLFVLLGLLTLFGCASSQTNREDSNYYRAQVEQGYPCPECGYLIPAENVSTNTRVKNECPSPSCRKIFFGIPVVKKTQEYEGKRGEKVSSSGLKSHGPRSVYESDTDYQYFWVGGESFKETETGYSVVVWSFGDRKVKSRRVVPHWTTTRYHYP